MEYIISIIIACCAIYVGYAYGQEALDGVNNLLERLRAIVKCISKCFKEQG
jgi:hypothetical protein